MLPEHTEVKLLEDVRQLIEAARFRAAVAVNQELSGLYWQVGHRIHTDVLRGQRAEYGKQVLKSLSLQLSQAYGKGWSEQQLRHCLRAAERIDLDTHQNLDVFGRPAQARVLY